MPGEYLLDTSVVIALFRGEPSVRDRLEESDTVYLSAVVLGELHYGAEGSDRTAEEVDRIRDFIRTCAPLACDWQTAIHYGRVKQALRRRGRPIPENDVWIAATAIQHGLTLAARDDHFREIEGLDLQRW